MTVYELAAPCLFGVEGILADELRRLSFDNVRAENGRVLFSGTASDIAAANKFPFCRKDNRSSRLIQSHHIYRAF